MRYTAAVITVSDKGYRGEREDTSGPNLCRILTEKGFDVTYTAMVPDEPESIKGELCKCADDLGIALVLTTGGTGFSPRDITPEATLAVVERLTPGIPEAMRAESMRITPKGCLSRSAAGIRGPQPDYQPARKQEGLRRKPSGSHRPRGPRAGYALQRRQRRLWERIASLFSREYTAGSTEIRRRLWGKNPLQSPKDNVTITMIAFRKSSTGFACALYSEAKKEITFHDPA